MHAFPRGWDRRGFLIVYLLLVVAGAAITLSALLRIPADPGSGWLLGFSRLRLVMVGSVSLVMALSILLCLLTWQRVAWGERLSTKLGSVLDRNTVYIPLAVLSLVGVVFGTQYYHLTRILMEPSLKAYFIRLLPLVVWGSVLCAQTLVVLPSLRYGREIFKPHPKTGVTRGVLQTSAIAFGVFLLLWGGIALTGLGITPDAVGWDEPGVPVIPIQVWLALLIGLIFLVCGAVFHKLPPRFRSGIPSIGIDITIGLVIWLAAVWLWSAQPMQSNYFAPRPAPPNFEYYPYSDASSYALAAQRLLIGQGYGGVGIKPLYILFLSVLHLASGQGYEDVVGLQVMCLALFPVIIYFLGTVLHHRLSGVLAATLITLRETNALALSGAIRVSHAKLMMTDLPSALGISLLVWLVVIWWRKRGQDVLQTDQPKNWGLLPLIAGGILGFVVLLRPQAFILLPALFAFMVIVFWRRLWHRPWLGLREAALCLLGFMLVISPWLWRGWQMTGRIVLNDPTQTTFLTEQYNIVPGSPRLYPQPGESMRDFDQRVQQTILNFVRQYPDIVAHFISAHFLHNQVESLLALPASPWFIYNFENYKQPDRLWQACCSPEAYTAALPFWKQWQGYLPGESWLPLLANLALVSLGLGVSWNRRGWGGLVPLGISLVYNFGNAISRYSGWRFILPVDWTMILYFAVGMGQTQLWLVALYLKPKEQIVPQTFDHEPGEASLKSGGARTSTLLVVATAAMLLLLGYSLYAVEKMIPVRYPPLPKEELVSKYRLADSLSQIKMGDVSVQAFLNATDSLVFQGRALYPRYYRAGQGGSVDGWAAYAPRDYNRLGFYLMGPAEAQVVLGLNEMPGSDSIPAFPNASDVIVIGCQTKNYVDALAVVILPPEAAGIQSIPGTVLLSAALPASSSSSQVCPLLHP